MCLFTTPIRHTPGVERISAGVERVSAGVQRVSTGVERVSAGVERVSAGVEREVSLLAVWIESLLVCRVKFLSCI